MIMTKNTDRKTINGKLGPVLACAALIAVLVTGTAFAASPGSFSFSGLSPSSIGANSINVAPSKDAVGGEVMHIIKNKTHIYSVDGGETWTDLIPDGFTLDSRGNLQKIK
jgi:hypothetical protein